MYKECEGKIIITYLQPKIVRTRAPHYNLGI